jgi:hypothetical protein
MNPRKKKPIIPSESSWYPTGITGSPGRREPEPRIRAHGCLVYGIQGINWIQGIDLHGRKDGWTNGQIVLQPCFSMFLL